MGCEPFGIGGGEGGEGMEGKGREGKEGKGIESNRTEWKGMEGEGAEGTPASFAPDGPPSSINFKRIYVCHFQLICVI